MEGRHISLPNVHYASINYTYWDNLKITKKLIEISDFLNKSFIGVTKNVYLKSIYVHFRLLLITNSNLAEVYIAMLFSGNAKSSYAIMLFVNSTLKFIDNT